MRGDRMLQNTPKIKTLSAHPPNAFSTLSSSALSAATRYPYAVHRRGETGGDPGQWSSAPFRPRGGVSVKFHLLGSPSVESFPSFPHAIFRSSRPIAALSLLKTHSNLAHPVRMQNKIPTCRQQFVLSPGLNARVYAACSQRGNHPRPKVPL